MSRFARWITVSSLTLSIASCASPPPSGPDCGNNVCETGETHASCPEDCPAPSDPNCGDGTCNGTETQASCPMDCGSPPPPPPTMCGDGTCAANETVSSCPADCAGLIVSNTSVYTIEYLYGWACGGTNSYINLLNGPLPSNYHVTFDSVIPGCWYLQAYTTGDAQVFNSVALSFVAGQTYTWTLTN